MPSPGYCLTSRRQRIGNNPPTAAATYVTLGEIAGQQRVDESRRTRCSPRRPGRIMNVRYSCGWAGSHPGGGETVTSSQTGASCGSAVPARVATGGSLGDTVRSASARPSDRSGSGRRGPRALCSRKPARAAPFRPDQEGRRVEHHRDGLLAANSSRSRRPPATAIRRAGARSVEASFIATRMSTRRFSAPGVPARAGCSIACTTVAAATEAGDDDPAARRLRDRAPTIPDSAASARETVSRCD